MPVQVLKWGARNIKLNAQPDRADLRDREFQPTVFSLPAEWPDAAGVGAFWLTFQSHGLVLDQKHEPACTGYGLAAVINYLTWIQAVKANSHANFQPVSPHMLYDLARFYDEWPGEQYDGSSCRGAMKGWHKHGACSQTLWTHSIHSAKTANSYYVPNSQWPPDASRRPLGVYYRIKSDSIADMQAAIVAVGAIYVSAEVHAGWTLSRKGKPATALSHAALPGIPLGGVQKAKGVHAFAIVGFNDRGFVVQNSWGTRWGHSGFAVLTYADWLRHGLDAWVSGMGVPTFAGANASLNQGNSVTGVASRQGAEQSLVKAWGLRKANPSTLAVQPWDSSDTAYSHTIVAGNDGKVDRSRVDYVDPVQRLDKVFQQLDQWLKQQTGGAKKVAIIVHGGLNSETASMERVKVLAPYFLANGIYPLFYVWKTGVMETIGQSLEDLMKGHPAEFKAGGRLRDRWNEFLESRANSSAFRWLWMQMKDNALRAKNPGHAIDAMQNHLSQLATKHPTMELHAIGHSAGSYVLGHWLEMGAKCASLSLYAPACTVKFAMAFQSAVAQKQIPANKFFLHTLDDRLEKDDSCPEVPAIYGNSLLYLVARGFEEPRKTPLIGLQKTREPGVSASDDNDLWSPNDANDITAWRAWLAANGIPQDVWKQPRVPTRAVSPRADTKATHGSFDNNCEVLTKTLQRILNLPAGTALPQPFEDLRY